MPFFRVFGVFSECAGFFLGNACSYMQVSAWFWKLRVCWRVLDTPHVCRSSSFKMAAWEASFVTRFCKIEPAWLTAVDAYEEPRCANNASGRVIRLSSTSKQVRRHLSCKKPRPFRFVGLFPTCSCRFYMSAVLRAKTGSTLEGCISWSTGCVVPICSLSEADESWLSARVEFDSLRSKMGTVERFACR